MIKDPLKFLRIAAAVYIAIAAVFWCFAFNDFIFPKKAFGNDLDRASHFANTTYYFAIWLLSVIIVVKPKPTMGNLLFVFLMVSNSVSPTLSVVLTGIPYMVAAVLYNMGFYTLLLKTFQYFPKEVTRQDIIAKIGWKPVRVLLLAAHSKKSWVIFPLISLAVAFLPLREVLFMLLLLVIIAYLYINLSKNKSDRNKVLWLFWGMDIFFACHIMNIFFWNFSSEDVQFVATILSITGVMALLLALIMSFFFFDTFNTGVIVKRTIINSFMLVLIVFIYNVTEHYLLHWVSHQLHLSDVLVSSVLSGILVMVFSPLHHKLMQFFEKKLKNEKPH